MGITERDNPIIPKFQAPISRKNNKYSRGLIVVLLAGFCFFCSSCGDSSHYERYHPIEDRYWDKEQEYFFTFDVTDISRPYDISIEVRNNNLYPYQNLWLFCTEETPSGEQKKDTVECILADDYGKWLGKGISLFQSSTPLHAQYKFREAGTYTFSFRQGMRNDQLPGIQAVGLRVIPQSGNP